MLTQAHLSNLKDDNANIAKLRDQQEEVDHQLRTPGERDQEDKAGKNQLSKDQRSAQPDAANNPRCYQRANQSADTSCSDEQSIASRCYMQFTNHIEQV